MRGSFGIAFAFVLALGPATEPAGAVETVIGSKELKLHELVNEGRSAAGLGTLSLRDGLSRKAERHSRRMVDRGVLFHSDLSGMAGEVVGYGPTVDAVFTQFMGSADHLDILLGTGWRKTGIGVVRGAGRIWVTQIVKG